MITCLECKHREVPPQSLSTCSPQAGGTRGVTVESRHPPSPADPQRAPRWVSGRCPRRFSPVPWSCVPGRGGWPELRPPLTQALQFLTRAQGCRGHWALRSKRVVSGEPEVRVSCPKADANSQAWPRQRLRVVALCPVASRSSSPSLTCSSSLSL